MANERVIKVAVLMATHNGINWLAEQIPSILGQREVQVKLIISDDASSDGTWEWLKNLAQQDDRVTLLPYGPRFGSAGRNYYRLILEADISDCDYVALADQDDIWLKSKLRKQVRLAILHNADGVSSNVVAFWPDGSRGLINKAEPMRKFDFLFESAGPGCTFLLSPWLVGRVREVLLNVNGVARRVELHDWLIYAVCRASGSKWYISPVPTIRYRQHAHNVVGANYGLKARLLRCKRIIQGWYRIEATKICEVSKSLSDDIDVQTVCDDVIRSRLFGKYKLLAFVSEARRSVADRLVLAVSILLFLI